MRIAQSMYCVLIFACSKQTRNLQLLNCRHQHPAYTGRSACAEVTSLSSAVHFSHTGLMDWLIASWTKTTQIRNTMSIA